MSVENKEHKSLDFRIRHSDAFPVADGWLDVGTPPSPPPFTTWDPATPANRLWLPCSLKTYAYICHSKFSFFFSYCSISNEMEGPLGIGISSFNIWKLSIRLLDILTVCFRMKRVETGCERMRRYCRSLSEFLYQLSMNSFACKQCVSSCHFHGFNLYATSSFHFMESIFFFYNLLRHVVISGTKYKENQSPPSTSSSVIRCLVILWNPPRLFSPFEV